MSKKHISILWIIVLSCLLFSACAVQEAAVVPHNEEPDIVQTPKPTVEPEPEIVVEYVTAELTSYEVKVQPNANPYSMSQQGLINSELRRLDLDRVFSLADPFVCIDPYRTSQLAMLMTFDDVLGYASYTIASPYGDEVYTKSFKDDGLTSAYELQIFGLFPNTENNIIVRIYDADDNLLKQADYTIDVPSMKFTDEKEAELADVNNPADLSIVETTGEASDGLYALIGCINPTHANQNMFFYDNNGYLRGLIYTAFRSNNLMMVEDGFIYANDRKQVIHSSFIGETIAIYETGSHSIHHDIVLDKDGNIIALTTNDDDATGNKEDWIIVIDKDTGEIIYEIDFKEYFGDMGDYYGRNNGDWMHLNSVDYIDAKGGTIVISSREMAAIFSFTGFDTQELALEYVINEGINAEIFGITDAILAPVGDVNYNLGQHSVRIIPGVDDEHYQIIYYNNFSADNNWRTSDEFPDKDIIDYYPDIPTAGEYSYATLLNINTAEMTFEEVGTIELAHSRRRSSAQKFLDNYIVASTEVGEIFELDADFNIIIKFLLAGEKNGVYRCFKYSIYD
ncbi:MAG: hypothetical protein HN389_05235 [Clostridia bacterium]|jgi:hypothetical protein|nr:hypothetical protein [Clostridia bacterium]